MDGKSLLPILTDGANRQFLIEYYGEGDKAFNDVECWSEVDEDNMAWCGADYFSCKCQDSTNNTYTCLRTIIQEEEEDSIFCLFEDDESFVEIYDLHLDPYQLTNLVPVEEEDFSKKMGLLSQLKSCK